MKRRLISLAAGLAFLLTGASVWATAFTGLYAFGDSLSDSGSSPSSVLSIYRLMEPDGCDPFHPCPPYYEGRYSNGPVAVEYLADSILTGGATPANFYNFSVSGSTTGVGNYGDGGTSISPGEYGLPGMVQQIGYYLSGSVIDPNALYFVWGGANDFITTYPNAIQAAQNVAGYVGALAAAGAEHFLVPNLPDLSYTPYIISLGQEAEDAANAYTMAFNAELAAELGMLNLLFQDADIVQFDTFSFLNDVVLNPADYGLTNSQDACLLSIVSTPCVDPDNYVFWDDFHPTTRADAIIASAFARAVPEPGTIALLAVGLFALMVAGSQRRKLVPARRGA